MSQVSILNKLFQFKTLVTFFLIWIYNFHHCSTHYFLTNAHFYWTRIDVEFRNAFCIKFEKKMIFYRNWTLPEGTNLKTMIWFQSFEMEHVACLLVSTSAAWSCLPSKIWRAPCNLSTQKSGNTDRVRVWVRLRVTLSYFFAGQLKFWGIWL